MHVFRDSKGRCYHLPIRKGEISNNLISCGSYERVELIGTLLSGAKKIAENRGLICINGNYKGLPVTAFTTGMGTNSTAIVLPEILDSVKMDQNVSLVRAGTAGSLQSYVKVGDVVVAKGAFRDEGATGKWIYREYPAISGTKLSLSLLATAHRLGFKLHKNLWYGIIHVKDELFATENPDLSAVSQQRYQVLHGMQMMGVLATEMEFAAYPILADLMTHNARSKQNISPHIDVGCIDLIVSPPHHTRKKTTTFENIDPKKIIRIGLDALILKQKWDNGKGFEVLKDVLTKL